MYEESFKGGYQRETGKLEKNKQLKKNEQQSAEN
jgi:hypothetical protein